MNRYAQTLSILLGLILLVPIAHAQETCSVELPDPLSKWDFVTSAQLRATVVDQDQSGVAGETWINRDRVVSSWVDEATGQSLRSRWDDAAGAWGPALSRTLFRATPDRDLAEVGFQRRLAEGTEWENIQRDIRAYDDRGHLTMDTRQDWTDSGSWADNRRARYERTADGLFTSQRFERFVTSTLSDKPTVQLDYLARTDFDDAGNRIRCDFFAEETAVDPYLTERTSFDAAGRPLTLYKDDFRRDDSKLDSTSLTYDAAGLLEKTETYRDVAGRREPLTRTLLFYDDERRLVETHKQRGDGTSELWGNSARRSYTYREDGLPETYTLERWDASAQRWNGQYRILYTSERMIATASEEDSHSESLPVALTVAPNPVVARASVRLDGPARTDVTVDLFDLLGRRVLAVHAGPIAAGPTTFPLDVEALAPGVYVVRVATLEGGTSRTVTVGR